MKKYPLVSIITPYFNNQDTIVETIECIKKQSYKNIEHIIIDDGSSIPAEKILINNLSNIKLIRQTNKGVAAARNNAVKQAAGEILVFLDADDLIDYLYVEKVVIAFLKKNISMVACYVKEFGRSQKRVKIKPFNLEEFYFHNTLFPSIISVSREFFELVEGYNESLKVCEDWDLYLRIAKINSNIFIIPEYLFFYRKHKDLSSLTDLMSKDKSVVHQAYYNLYTENNKLYDKILISPLNVAYLKLKMEKRVKKIFRIIYIFLAVIILCAIFNLKISHIDNFVFIANVAGIVLILILMSIIVLTEKKLSKFDFNKIPKINVRLK